VLLDDTGHVLCTYAGEHPECDCANIAPRLAGILAHARAQALRDAAETIPEVGDVLRRMAAREVGDE
jgi:hypothetical protein